MRKGKIFKILGLTLALFLLLAPAAVLAAEKKAKAPAEESQVNPPFAKPYPVGQVTINLKSVGAGVGIQWGSGVLTYEGKQYTFKIRGLQAVTVGIASATVKGDVYNMFGLSDFTGRYVAAGAGIAFFKGKAGIVFRNSNGVHLLLNAQEKGVKLNAGPEGFTIRMEQAL